MQKKMKTLTQYENGFRVDDMVGFGARAMGWCGFALEQDEFHVEHAETGMTDIATSV